MFTRAPRWKRRRGLGQRSRASRCLAVTREIARVQPGEPTGRKCHQPSAARPQESWAGRTPWDEQAQKPCVLGSTRAHAGTGTARGEGQGCPVTSQVLTDRGLPGWVQQRPRDKEKAENHHHKREQHRGAPPQATYTGGPLGPFLEDPHQEFRKHSAINAVYPVT